MKYEDKAKAAAMKVCGMGECYAPYPCNHKNHACCGLSPITDDDTCPMEKYHVVEKDERPWYEVPCSEREVTTDDIFYLCANCDYAVVESVGDGYEQITRVGFKEHCLDCPVKLIEDSIQEDAAEAVMS